MRGAVPLMIVLAWSVPAHAQTCEPVAIVDCDESLDVPALRSALRTEGMATDTCGLVARCEGDWLSLEGRDARWELSTIAPAVRARVVAILIAEWLRSGSGAGSEPEPEPEPGSPSPPEPEPEPGSERLPAPEPSPAPESLPAPESSSAPEPKPEVARALSSPPAPPPRRAHPGALFVAHRAELAPGAGPRFGVGADLFLFLDPTTTLVGPTVTFGKGALRVEAGWTFGGADDPRLGSVQTTLGHASAGAGLVCVRFTNASACASALATLGYARVHPRPNDMAVSQDAKGVYTGGALELGVWLTTRYVAATLAVRGGWGYGIVAAAGEDDLAAIGGGWIGAHLSVELEPVR